MGAYPSPDAFRSSCAEHFQFLVDDFGCELLAHALDFVAVYNNATTIVRISAGGYGSQISVGLGRVERVRYELETYPLEKLLLIRCKTLSLVGPGGYPTNNDQEFQLPHYAKALRDHAQDILRGDFSVWPALRKKGWPRKRANKRAKKET